MNDALAVHFAEKTLATAFVARWCVAQTVEIVDEVYWVRDDEPTPHVKPQNRQARGRESIAPKSDA
jgi:hypothetical protein